MNGRPGAGDVEPLISWRTRARLTLVGMLALVGAAWHLAVAWTSAGVDVSDPRPTVRAALRLSPLAGLGEGAPAHPVLTLVLWVVLLLAEFTAYLAWAWYLGSRRARRRARVPVVRVPDVPPPWREQPPHPRRHVRRCARSSPADRRGRRRP